jgi:hypothetical protein
MLNENAKRWIKALRSRKYKQGYGLLHRVDEMGNHLFCCLGVACELYNESVAPEHRLKVASDGGRYFRYNEQRSTLPGEVVKWLGLSDSTGTYFVSSLIAENDRLTPFASIADIIESEPIGLFIR